MWVKIKRGEYVEMSGGWAIRMEELHNNSLNPDDQGQLTGYFLKAERVGDEIVDGQPVHTEEVLLAQAEVGDEDRAYMERCCAALEKAMQSGGWCDLSSVPRKLEPVENKDVPISSRMGRARPRSGSGYS